MTNEELYINNKMGRRNPFTVPDGYFDKLAAQVMEKLPEEKPRVALIKRLRPLLYAAACACLLFVSATIYRHATVEVQEPARASLTKTTTTDDDYLEEAADYAMIDNYDIYACLVIE